MPGDAEPDLPHAFPPGFFEGPGDPDAAFLLRCLLGITPRRLFVLAWDVGSAGACVRAVLGGRAGSDRDRAFLRDADVGVIRRRVARVGARVALPGDPEYWPAFLRLKDPPIALFLRGQPLGLGADHVAVVGSRRPSALGKDVAKDLARGLAASGVVVVSGGALGIDAIAHRGALDAAGRTVAVLGSGIDVAYPSGSRQLLREIERVGTLLSEYPPGVPAEPHRFPARNRLIAALSRGVVVVEGAQRSGTRITADHAMDLGIDVFAVPGPVTSPLAETPLELIRDGAVMIRGADDLLHDLGLNERSVPPRAGPIGLPPEEQRVYDALDVAMLPDAVARRTGLGIADAVGLLIQLELRGIVRGIGGRYERTFEGLVWAGVGDGDGTG
ncbi:MAG: DNA-processing protein DprA [Actinomycetota bacterium]